MSADRSDRFRRLVDAGIALSSELSLDELLRRVVETAVELTGARYGALGVIDASGRRLERFLPVGLDEDAVARIGAFPTGRGVLGVLIEDAAPLRLDDVTAHARSAGFPPGHPPMRSFLGVPIVLRGQPFGNLYLTDKHGGAAFTAEDEDVAGLLASQAAVAIENARLYASAVRWSRQLESLIEVGNALADEYEPTSVLELVCKRLRELLAARFVHVALALPDGSLRVEASAGKEGEGLVGYRLDARASKAGRVLERRRSERVDDAVADPEVDQEFVRTHGVGALLLVPLVVRERAIGVLAVHDREGDDPRFGDADLRLAEVFATRAAVAIDLARRVERGVLLASVRAQEDERRRLARELHDETGQALASILLGVRAVREAATGADADEAGERLRELASDALENVRRLAFELRPKALDDFGLEPALRRLGESVAEQSDLVVDVAAHVSGRLGDDVETAVYRTVQEALTNVVRHAAARTVRVRVELARDAVTADVADDGRGFDPRTAGASRFGLVGMRERVMLLGGDVVVESAPGSGTRVAVSIPLGGADDSDVSRRPPRPARA